MRTTVGVIIAIVAIVLLSILLYEQGLITNTALIYIAIPAILLIVGLRLITYLGPTETVDSTGKKVVTKPEPMFTGRQGIYIVAVLAVLAVSITTYYKLKSGFPMWGKALVMRQQQTDLDAHRATKPSAFEFEQAEEAIVDDDRMILTIEGNQKMAALKKEWQAEKMDKGTYIARRKAISREYKTTLIENAEPVVVKKPASTSWFALPAINLPESVSRFHPGVLVALLVLLAFGLLLLLMRNWKVAREFLGLFLVVLVVALGYDYWVHSGKVQAAGHSQGTPAPTPVPESIKHCVSTDSMSIDEAYRWHHTNVFVGEGTVIEITRFNVYNPGFAPCTADGCPDVQIEGPAWVTDKWNQLVVLGQVGDGQIYRNGSINTIHADRAGEGLLKLSINQVMTKSAWFNMEGGFCYKIYPPSAN